MTLPFVFILKNSWSLFSSNKISANCYDFNRVQFWTPQYNIYPLVTSAQLYKSNSVGRLNKVSAQYFGLLSDPTKVRQNIPGCKITLTGIFVLYLITFSIWFWIFQSPRLVIFDVQPWGRLNLNSSIIPHSGSGHLWPLGQQWIGNKLANHMSKPKWKYFIIESRKSRNLPDNSDI